MNTYDQSKLMKGRVYPFAENELPAGNGATSARYTGETRPPRKGELFLSGAIIEAYWATSDMDEARPIGKPIVVCG